ncbi:transposase [Candidatus Azambacteria bacterium]|nr:transposase [Candidatus Azambacteria bacterium]MBI3685540.1 transposase [Candidatus Azambacteria bacterium]
MKKPPFVNDHIYHIYNRGVEKRDIFLSNRDYFRFIHNLFEFNDEAPAANLYYKLPAFQSYEVQLRKIGNGEQKPRKCIVDILAFCLMRNHFHLLLKQKTHKGIVTFMQKLGTGYTNYFNKKHERVGSLFQGRFKAVLIENEPHFLYLPLYIHANPLAIISSAHGKNLSSTRALRFLESYRWSSYPDYIGKKNFPSVTQRKFLLELFGKPAHHRNEMSNWIREAKLDPITDVIIE